MPGNSASVVYLIPGRLWDNSQQRTQPAVFYRLVGLVVKASASRAEGPGFESRLRRDFLGRVTPVT